LTWLVCADELQTYHIAMTRRRLRHQSCKRRFGALQDF
jgi:hypothetical protein